MGPGRTAEQDDLTMARDSEKGKEAFPWSAPPLRMTALLGGVALAGVLVGILIYAIWADGTEGRTGQSVGEKKSKALGADSDGAGPGTRFRVQFSTETLFPSFHPDQRRYVTRCGPGGVDVRVNAFQGAEVEVEGSRPATGRFQVEARPAPGQDFLIRAEGAGSGLDGRYVVRCLPSGFPQWDYEQYRTPPKGLFTVSIRARPAERNRGWVIGFEQNGLPRWWFSPNLNALWAEILPDGTFQWARGFGDGFGQDSRSGIELTELSGRRIGLVRSVGMPNDSHEFVELPNGNALVMGYRPRFGVDLSRFGLGEDEGVLDGEIQEVTPDGDVVWRWNSGEHIALDETPTRWWQRVRANPHPDPEGRDRFDVFHLNSIEPIGDDALLISTRHTDAVFAISRATGEVLWKVGGTRTEKSLEVIGPDPYRDDPLNANHDARLNDGVLSVYDNGSITARPPRLVRYRIDPEAGTATFLSQIEPPEGIDYSHCCGSARRFGAGWLVSWGGKPFVTGYDREGLLAFRLELSEPTYRAVPVPASVSPADLDRALDQGEEAIDPPGEATGPILRVPVGPEPGASD